MRARLCWKLCSGSSRIIGTKRGKSCIRQKFFWAIISNHSPFREAALKSAINNNLKAFGNNAILLKEHEIWKLRTGA